MTQSHANARNNQVTYHEDEMTQAERIRRLEHRCDMEAAHIAELKAQIRSLRALLAVALEQRDEARREVCGHDEFIGGAMLEAKRRGWDCFDSQQFSVEGELE